MYLTMRKTFGGLGAYDSSALADVAMYFRVDPATLDALLTRHNVSGAYLSWLAEHPRQERATRTPTADTVHRLLVGMKIPHGNPVVPGYPTFFGLPNDPEWTAMMDNAAAAYQAGFTMYGATVAASVSAEAAAGDRAKAIAANALTTTSADVEYWTVVNNVQQGPFSLTTLAKKIQIGEITSDALIWTEGLDDWMPLEQVTGLAQYLPITAAVTPVAVEAAPAGIDWSAIQRAMQAMPIGVAPATIEAAPVAPTITPVAQAQVQLVQPYYIGKSGQRFGPITLEYLRDQISAGNVSADVLVWTIGMANWMIISQTMQFGAYYQQPQQQPAYAPQPVYTAPQPAPAQYQYPAEVEQPETAVERGGGYDEWEA